jgi:enolase
MDISQSAYNVKSITWRRILNSYVEFTNEFIIEFENGNIGIGASPQGETISVYEDKSTRSDAQKVVEEIKHDRLLDNALTQADFDSFLQLNINQFGRNNCWALSLAFNNAVQSPPARFWSTRKEAAAKFPRLCLNILNGGHHAYTNPVLSDFHEYLIVPKHDNVKKVIQDHAQIQQDVREMLLRCERVVVNQNPVHRFRTTDNKECIAFLSGVLERLDLSREYDIMIDVSGGDLWTGKGYRFSVTDGSSRSTSELIKYWMDLIDEFGIKFLEDPFQEYDYRGWKMLTHGQSDCKIIGDNLYSSDADRIEQGSRDGYTHGAIVKPNQAGTVSAVRAAIEALQKYGQLVITSHRSISTESTFLAPLTVFQGVGYMKIGPLYTDYSSVMRLNELIRLTRVNLG